VQEHSQVHGVDLVQDLQPAPAEPTCPHLHGHRNGCLPGCAAPTLAADLHSTDERLVDLDVAGQQIR